MVLDSFGHEWILYKQGMTPILGRRPVSIDTATLYLIWPNLDHLLSGYADCLSTQCESQWGAMA